MPARACAGPLPSTGIGRASDSSNRTFEPLMGRQDQNHIFLKTAKPYVMLLQAAVYPYLIASLLHGLGSLRPDQAFRRARARIAAARPRRPHLLTHPALC